MTRKGIQVQYSFPGLKVHAKVALIRRREGKHRRNYVYLSTGNFHENTVKVYSDLGLFTTNTNISEDVAQLFSLLESGQMKSYRLNAMLVGKFNLREELERLILFEIKEAKASRKAEILLKMNSLQDPKMIYLLYQASRAGVRIRLIVRGICSLVPGRKDWSENIKAISIVDRYLEHSRIFLFHHRGKNKMYSGSADWMERNLSRRIETVFPITSPRIKSELMEYLDIQWNDNVKARQIHAKKNNSYRKGKPVMHIQSQLETYYYYKRKEDRKK